MKNVLVGFVSVMVCLTPATLLADGGPVPSTLNGKSGFWVPVDLFVELERRYEDHPKVEAKLAVKEEEVSALRLSLQKKTESASTAMERRAFFKNAYDAERAAHALTREDAKRGLLESPGLWLTVGALTTGLVVFLTRDDSPDTVVVTSP